MGGPLYVWLMYVASRPFNSVFEEAEAGAGAVARLIMRATLAIKTTEAISNVESPHRGRERGREGSKQIRLAFRYRRKIAAAFRRPRGRGIRGLSGSQGADFKV